MVIFVYTVRSKGPKYTFKLYVDIITTTTKQLDKLTEKQSIAVPIPRTCYNMGGCDGLPGVTPLEWT